MVIPKASFMVNATAKKVGENADSALDKAIRVGVKIGDDFLIFAPNGGNTSYKVTSNVGGTAFTDVTAKTAETAIGSTGDITIPKASSDGIEADVYVWYEGEDTNCKSENIAAILNDYKIDVTFKDAT